ncbi:MAG: rubredoxin [Nanoarchaeota archaeon]|nr:rubredoxin [Nanoarchaeota archaeon]
MSKWICNVCGFVYDEELGDSDSEINPGTKFEDIPDTWECPECGANKKDPSNWIKLED